MKTVCSFLSSIIGSFRSGWKIALVVLAVAFACAPSAHAGGVVSICDQPHLLAALSGGGLVTFNCGGPAYFAVSFVLISSNTTVDGSGQNITISINAGSGGQVFIVQPGIRFHLNRITITGGIFAGELGGGIYNAGTLTVTNSTFSGNEAGFGGGI